MATVADMSRFRMVITSTICTTVICTGATAITLTNVNPATATACMTGRDHTHGDGCGHVAVPHGDHVDYIHDGCRHAAHDGHYDEH